MTEARPPASSAGSGAAAPVRDGPADASVEALLADWRASATRRRALAGERVIDTPALLAYVSDVESPDVNLVVRTRFSQSEWPDVDAAIRATIGLFGGRPFLWWIAPGDEPPDLHDRLEATPGLTFLDHLPGMAMDLADLAAENDVPPPPELDIRPVLDADELAAFHSVVTEGFPEDFADAGATAAIAAATAAIAAETRYREPGGLPTRWLGRVDGRPVTTTRLHTAAGVAGVYTVITVADARRRGYGAAITRRALIAARDAGFRLATLQASPAGEGIYARMGFREICRFALFEWRAPLAEGLSSMPPSTSSSSTVTAGSGRANR